jgi:hypothetical protein
MMKRFDNGYFDFTKICSNDSFTYTQCVTFFQSLQFLYAETVLLKFFKFKVGPFEVQFRGSVHFDAGSFSRFSISKLCQIF